MAPHGRACARRVLSAPPRGMSSWRGSHAARTCPLDDRARAPRVTSTEPQTSRPPAVEMHFSNTIVAIWKIRNVRSPSIGRRLRLSMSLAPLSAATARIAWIGTGVMGTSMCGHLIAAGCTAAVYSRTPSRATGLVSRGASMAGSAADAAKVRRPPCALRCVVVSRPCCDLLKTKMQPRQLVACLTICTFLCVCLFVSCTPRY